MPAAFPASSVDSALKTYPLEICWKEENYLEEGTVELLFKTGDVLQKREVLVQR